MPLLQIPTPFSTRNSSSAFEHSAFVGSAISDLIRQGCVTEVFEKHIIIKPLSVSIQKFGKERLILDLRHVNQFLFKQKFRCEDLSVAKEVLCPANYMLSFDLKWGYHHVEIFPDQRKYLSFSWTFSCGRTRFFEFTVLSFGLSSAPCLFMKLLKPLVRKWRSEAKGIVVYLDDGLGSAADYNNAKTASSPAHADLCHSGFLANESRCVWNRPRLFRGWGPLSIRPLLVAATDKRIVSLQDILNSILSVSSVRIPVRQLASVCGKIISLTNCVGNVSRLTTRNLFAVINSA